MGRLRDVIDRVLAGVGIGSDDGRTARNVEGDAGPRRDEPDESVGTDRSDRSGSVRGRRDPEFDPRTWVEGSGYPSRSDDESQDEGVGDGGRGTGRT